jgi:nitrite reductase (NADH) large subunit
MHHVIIGNGIAGSHAAAVLRERDPGSQITIISGGALLFYNRYDLPDVFRGRCDWVDYLVYPPDYYQDNKIKLRRKSLVTELNTEKRTLTLAHREIVTYDQLLVATGGSAYVPERLLDSIPLMHNFNNFRVAMTVRNALPDGGVVIMLGGDALGLDLARTLIKTKHKVILIAGDRTFWPHEVGQENRSRCLLGLKKMHLEVIDKKQVDRVEQNNGSGPARRVIFDDGSDVTGDVVMPFYGLSPSVDFMSHAGIDIERGILVDPQLQTTQDNIWAAGDVCQIWSPEHNAYRFYYGWKNVKMMGDVAARNMTGDDVPFTTTVDEVLKIKPDGTIYSPFWEHD